MIKFLNFVIVALISFLVGSVSGIIIMREVIKTKPALMEYSEKCAGSEMRLSISAEKGEVYLICKNEDLILE